MDAAEYRICELAGSALDRCAERLRAIFRDAVLITSREVYSAEQAEAWASSADTAAWRERIASSKVWAATAREGPARVVGFVSLNPTDHVDRLYVAPERARRGIARALLEAVDEAACVCRLGAVTADASLLAYPVFARAGYELVAWEDVAVRGISFRRASMRKRFA